MSSQWKQFVQLYAEKNQHLSHQQVLQMAKKPFQELKQYYKQQGGEDLHSFPICEEQITLDMLGDEEEDIKLLKKKFSDHDKEFFGELQEIIEASCWGVVLNGEEILYNYYDTKRSKKEIKQDELTRTELIKDIREYLLKDSIKSEQNFFFDIYLFADQWTKGSKVEFGPRKYHIEYDTEEKKFTVSIFTKSKDSF